MRTLITRFLISSVVIFLAACSTSSQMTHLSADMKKNIGSVDTQLIVSQKEIFAQVPATNTGAAVGMHFGMVGILIGSIADSVANQENATSASNYVKPIQDALIDFDFVSLLKENLDNKLEQLSWIDAEKVSASSSAIKKDVIKIYEDSNSDAVMLMFASYSLSPLFNNLESTLNVQILPKSEVLKSYKKSSKTNNENPVEVSDSIYYGEFKVVKELLITKTKKKNAALLKKKGGDYLKPILVESIKELVDKFTTDLQKTKKPKK